MWMQLEMPSMFTTFFSAYNGGIERGRVSLNEHALGLYGDIQRNSRASSLEMCVRSPQH